MIYSSQDILYIVIAFSVLWLTIFISWSLYYVAMILRGAYRLFGEMKQKLDLIDRFISMLTSKLEHTTTSLQLLVDGVGKMAGYLLEKKETKSKTNTVRRKKKSSP